MKDVRGFAQARNSGSPAGSVVIPSFSDVPEKVFSPAEIEAYTKAVRQRLMLVDNHSLSGSSPGSVVIPSYGKSPGMSIERARLKDLITADYYKELQERDRVLVAPRGDDDDGDEEEDGRNDELRQAHSSSSSSSSSSSLLSGLQRGARSQPAVCYADGDNDGGDSDGGGFLSRKEFNGTMGNTKRELVATIAHLRGHLNGVSAYPEQQEKARLMQLDYDRMLAQNVEMARHIERLQQAEAARNSRPRSSPPREASGRKLDQGTLRRPRGADGGAGGGDDDDDDSSVFSGVSRHSAREELGRQLGALARDGPPGIRGIREDGLSQLSLGSSDDSDVRLTLFAKVQKDTRGSRSMKLFSDHEYDLKIREGLIMPCLDGSVFTRRYPKTAADKERTHCIPIMTLPDVLPFDGEVSYLQANSIPTGTAASLLEMIREAIKAFSTSSMAELRKHGPESEYEALHVKLLGEQLILYHENIGAAAIFMGISDKEPRHCHCVTRTLSFYKWHEQRWRKYVIDNICVLPTALDATSRKELEATTNWINETFDDSLRQGPTREQSAVVTVPKLMLALRVLFYCCEYCGTLGFVGSICRTKGCTDVDDSKQLLITWTAAKDRVLAKAVADNAKASGSTPLTYAQKAAVVNTWVLSSPANAKPNASTPVTVAFLCDNQHLIRDPIVTVLKFSV